MAKTSAALLPYRDAGGVCEVFLVHPGGPHWASKDDGVWSLAKGEYEDGEPALAAAQREFTEETGFTATGDFVPLGSVTLASGKVITAWAVRADFDARAVHSNTFALAWPPRSGRVQHFPEVDRGEWFSLTAARRKLTAAQLPFLDALRTLVPAHND